MKRRTFTKLTGVGLAALTLPIASCLPDIQYHLSLAQPHSLFQIWDTETLQMVGTNYRNRFPQEKNERSLVKKLLANISSDAGDLTEMIAQKSKEDFKNKETVMIDGWILSRTEARQCALFTITQPNE